MGIPSTSPCHRQGVASLEGWSSGQESIHGSVSVRGHRPASGVRLVRVPPIQTCSRTPGAKRVWNFASSGGRAPY